MIEKEVSLEEIFSSFWSGLVRIEPVKRLNLIQTRKTESGRTIQEPGRAQFRQPNERKKVFNLIITKPEQILHSSNKNNKTKFYFVRKT